MSACSEQADLSDAVGLLGPLNDGLLLFWSKIHSAAWE